MDDIGAEQLQRAPQYDRGCHAVDAVVAVDGDAPAVGDRCEDAIDGKMDMSASANGSSRSSSEGDKNRLASVRSEIPRIQSNLAVTGAIFNS